MKNCFFIIFLIANVNFCESILRTGELMTTRLGTVCVTQERAAIMRCHCDHSRPNTATHAYCWIFGYLHKENIIWNNFTSQLHLQTLLFNVITEPGLDHIPTDLVRNLTHLRVLDIEFANINTIKAFAFANSASLLEISLAKNQINNLEPYGFAHLTALNNLSLADNHITEIKAKVFHDLPYLRDLKLSNNKITTLEPTCFRELYSLLYLNLNSNKMTVLKRASFEGLFMVRQLSIKHNQVSYIGDLTFVDFWNLKELYLDYNQIKFITERGFAGMLTLQRLSLSGNQLTFLHSKVFIEMPNILHLDLSNNHIKELKQVIFRPILINLEKPKTFLNLIGNNLPCDCHLAWLFEFRNNTGSQRIQHMLDNLFCETDLIFSNSTTDKQSVIPQTINGTGNFDYENSEEKYAFDEDENYAEEIEWNKNFNSSTDYGSTKLLDIPLDQLPCSETVKNSKYQVNEDISNKGNASGVSLFMFSALIALHASFLFGSNK